MLKLSSRTNYGVRALVDLAVQLKAHPKTRRLSGTDREPVTLSAIAARQDIPQPFLEQIFAHLRRAGLVEAVRGARGGYRLGRPARQIRIGDVVAALEGPLGPALCTMPQNFGPDCHEVDGCLSRVFCRKLDGQIQKVMNATSIADLCQETARTRAKRIPIKAVRPALQEAGIA
jgi:Rrf2 family transcriptional regulator, cysteine metabolism repressor